MTVIKAALFSISFLNLTFSQEPTEETPIFAASLEEEQACCFPFPHILISCIECFLSCVTPPDDFYLSDEEDFFKTTGPSISIQHSSINYISNSE